jgi:hypothetical protein
MEKTVNFKYAHQELNQEVQCISGYYTPLEEIRLKMDQGEALIVLGFSCVDSSCCGIANWNYAVVPGYIVHWKAGKNANGQPVTEVSPVKNATSRTEITDYLKKNMNVTNVEFW